MVVLATAFAQVGTQSVREENERRPPSKRLLALFTLPSPAVDQSFRSLLSELRWTLCRGAHAPATFCSREGGRVSLSKSRRSLDLQASWTLGSPVCADRRRFTCSTSISTPTSSNARKSTRIRTRSVPACGLACSVLALFRCGPITSAWGLIHAETRSSTRCRASCVRARRSRRCAQLSLAMARFYFGLRPVQVWSLVASPVDPAIFFTCHQAQVRVGSGAPRRIGESVRSVGRSARRGH